MLFRVNYGGESHLTKKDLKNFSDSKYACKHLFQTPENTVIIVSQSKSRKVKSFRVAYNFTNVFFSTEEDALTFIKERFGNIKEAQ